MKKPSEIENKYLRRSLIVFAGVVLTIGYFIYAAFYKSAKETYKEAIDIKMRIKRAW